MIWIDSISQLQYYNNPPDAPCYCENIVYPADLILQGSFFTNASYLLTVNVLSASGTTTYEDATNYFEYYFFTYNGLKYFNLRLKSYSPAMCQYKCWILQVKVESDTVIYFNKYTQRYCQADCCDVPRGITFTDEDVQYPQTDDIVSAPLPVADCGLPLIRIEVTFPCVDNQLGDYYDIPSGQTWGFKKITNLPGRIVQRPREIIRQISYNCNLQRSESFKPYLLEGVGFESTFPTWKMNELEAMFHAPEPIISDFETSAVYQFAGGPIVEQVYSCWEIFKLRATLQSCTVRQTFGCEDNCIDGRELTFLIPEDGSTYYSENRVFIGDYDNLLAWYAGQNLVSSVEDVTDQYANVAHAFTVTGSSYIPTQFYYNSPIPRNRVYGTLSPVSPAISCMSPVIGTIVITTVVCPEPVIGTILITAEEDAIAEIASYGDWLVADVSEVIIADGTARMRLEAVNNVLTETSPLTYFISEIIGTIEPPGRPSTPQSITIDDVLLTIDIYGTIRYSGYATSYTETEVTISFTDIYYQL